MAISILPIGSSKNKGWWVALNKGFVYDIMDSAMKKAGMYDSEISSSLGQNETYENYSNYFKYEPPRIYCVEDGVPLICLSSYLYPPNVKKEPSETDQDHFKEPVPQADIPKSSIEKVQENKLDSSLSEQMHHLDIKVPFKDAEAHSTQNISSVIPHRPMPLKRRYASNPRALSINYKVARNSALNSFSGILENTPSVDVDTYPNLDSMIHLQQSLLHSDSNFDYRKCIHVPNKCSSGCPYCINSELIKPGKDIVCNKENTKHEYSFCKDQSPIAATVKVEEDNNLTSNQFRNKTIAELKPTSDPLRERFRNSIFVPPTIKQCKGTTIYGNDGQIYKQIDGSICDAKNRSLMSISDTTISGENSRDKSSPKLGWVAVSREDVNSLLDTVLESMIKEEEEDVIRNAQESEAGGKTNSDINLKKDNLEEADIHKRPNTIFESLDNTHKDSNVLNIEPNCNSAGSCDDSTSALTSSEAAVKKEVGESSSFKSDKCFKWKSSMLERLNEQSALNDDTDNSSENCVVKRTTRFSSNKVRK